MIGRRINGEQAEHLARFMDLHRQTERCAFEEASTAGWRDFFVVMGGTALILVVTLILAPIIDSIQF